MTLNYGGSGKQVLNEMDKDIVCLWEVVRDKKDYACFIKKLECVQYSRETFQRAKKEECPDKVGRAVRTFILLTQSYNSTRQAFSKKRNDYYAEKNLYYAMKVHDRLQQIEIRSEDAIGILERIKNDWEAFVFLDPPYLHEYRGKGADKAYGKREMTKEEHRRMLEIVRDAKCKVMICGYRSQKGKPELYDHILRESRTGTWHCYLLAEIQKPNKGGERAKEYIWVNYELPDYAEYLISMDDKMQEVNKNGDCTILAGAV